MTDVRKLRNMPYLVMLRKVEKRSWIHILMADSTKVLCPLFNKIKILQNIVILSLIVVVCAGVKSTNVVCLHIIIIITDLYRAQN